MSYHSLRFRRKDGRAIFLDRDGTIIKDRADGPILYPRELEFEEGAIEGMRIMQHLGYHLIVVSNQSGIGRGVYTLEQCEAVNKRMQRRLLLEGIILTGIYFCPHKKEDNCNCRKPKTGMLEDAEREYGIKLRESYMIGNSLRDIKTGQNAGLEKSILVETGNVRISDEVVPDATVKSLAEGVKYVKTLGLIWD